MAHHQLDELDEKILKLIIAKKSIVTVTSKGKIKAMKKGTAKVTVKSGSKKTVITVTVK